MTSSRPAPRPGENIENMFIHMVEEIKMRLDQEKIGFVLYGGLNCIRRKKRAHKINSVADCNIISFLEVNI